MEIIFGTHGAEIEPPEYPEFYHQFRNLPEFVKLVAQFCMIEERGGEVTTRFWLQQWCTAATCIFESTILTSLNFTLCFPLQLGFSVILSRIASAPSGGSVETELTRAKKELQMEAINPEKAGKERGRKTIGADIV